MEYARWTPFKDHLYGDQKGLAFDDTTKSVPFIAVDLDRHTGDVRAEDHQRIVIKAGRFLCEKVPHFKWLAEVNPKNGSAKFFGFRRLGFCVAKLKSQELSSKIRQGLRSRGLCHGNNVEVFPDNCKAVWFPLRRDKISIVDSGVVRRCTRKTRDYRFYPERVLEPIRVYSALQFMEWLKSGDSYDEPTLKQAVRHSCANLPDEVVEAVAPVVSTKVTAPLPAARELADSAPIKQVQISCEYETEEPDAFKRNWNDLLPFSREFYRSNKRLPNTNEALSYLKKYKLYSGDWKENETHRRHRVASILKKIAEQFDPTLLRKNKPFQIDPQISRWCRKHFFNGIFTKRRFINRVELNSKIKLVHVPAKFVGHCVGVIAFCLNDHNDDDSLPVNRIKAVWAFSSKAPSWNQERFQIVRNELEKLKVIDIYDKNHAAGKAWKWRKGASFPEKKKGTGKITTCKRPNTEGVRERKNNKIKEVLLHNSLYKTLNPISETDVVLAQSRPPPSRNGPMLASSHEEICS